MGTHCLSTHPPEDRGLFTEVVRIHRIHTAEGTYLKSALLLGDSGRGPVVGVPVRGNPNRWVILWLSFSGLRRAGVATTGEPIEPIPAKPPGSS